MDTLYWFDFETSGLSPACDRPTQFAGLRTDLALNPVGEPLMIYCRPAPDLLPSPLAAQVTGVTPQQADQLGVPEPEFIAAIEAEMAQSGTCSVGYNSLRFDDEVTRYSLYRNFYDPYAREWQSGNSRWDLLEVARFAWALRPEGIVWPQRDNGMPSLRLEALTAANGLAHEAAHDALSDVTATIALAKLIKHAQPKLYDYAWQRRGKHAVAEFVDPRQRKPFLHVSGRLPAEHGYTALMMPLAAHPSNKNAVICVDLSRSVEPLLTLSAEQLRERLYTRSDQLPDGVERLGLKLIQVNKCPMVATAALLDEALAERHNIDRQQCWDNAERLKAADLTDKLQAIYSDRPAARPDADQQLYGGFPVLPIRHCSIRSARPRPSSYSPGLYNLKIRVISNCCSIIARAFIRKLSAIASAHNGSKRLPHGSLIRDGVTVLFRKLTPSSKSSIPADRAVLSWPNSSPTGIGRWLARSTLQGICPARPPFKRVAVS